MIPKTDLTAAFEASLDSASVRVIQDWVARSSFWIDPEVVRQFGPRPVFPQTRRSIGNEAARTFVGTVALWKNEPAASACWRALGFRVNGATPRDFMNGNVCHIYDGSPSDPEHFTRLPNLIVLPRVLDKFTEWTPVQHLLKLRAWQLYGYAGPKGEPPVGEMPPGLAWAEPRYLPKETLPDVIAELDRLSREKPSYYITRR